MGPVTSVAGTERAAGLTAKGRFPEAVAEQPDCKLKTGVRMGKSSSFELSVCWVDSRIYM